jgi:predicted DCC family thiol-disulfide oxidoreductase YuxK
MSRARDIILYDGSCGLCHGFVRRVWLWDTRGHFVFAPIQGPTAQAILGRHGVTEAALKGMWLATDWETPEERLMKGSDAAVGVVRRLPGWPRLLGVLGWLPRSWREWGYGWIAKHRYAWFGRAEESCPLPASEDQSRMLP